MIRNSSRQFNNPNESASTCIVPNVVPTQLRTVLSDFELPTRHNLASTVKSCLAAPTTGGGHGSADILPLAWLVL